MDPGPSQAAEAIVAILLPPACREEVLGDLHERYRSPAQYGAEAACTVPLVILSRIRRTSDPQVLLMHAFAWYVSFLVAARVTDGALLNAQWGLVRLAIPAGVAVLVLMLEDAYARPVPRSALQLARGPVLGLGFALLSQGMFRLSNPDLALPGRIAFYGCAAGLLLSSAVRLLFPPVMDQLKGAHVPADWLKRSGGSDTRVVEAIAVIVALLLILLVVFRAWKRV
jgi:hypothetical protein